MSGDTRLVLIGGGHSHVEVLRRFAMKPHPPCNLTLVARDMLAPYSGMLPGFIAGHYTHDQAHIDVRHLARAAGARTCHTEVTGIDLDQRIVRCTGRPDVPFDLLSINTGSRPAVADVPGARAHAWPAKPVDAFIDRWESLLADLVAHPRPHRIVVVGGGAGGIELALAMRHRLDTDLGQHAPQIQLSIVSADRDPLPTHAPGVRRRMKSALRAQDIQVHPGERATDVTSADVRAKSGAVYPYDTLIWTTHASPLPWLRDAGLAVDDRGFVAVNEFLQSTSHPNVFAAGDTASLQHAPRPKSGVFAVREGPYLATNIERHLVGKPLERFDPQPRHLGLISTGGKHAVASWGPFSAGGDWVWRWKDRIDRTWMAKYQSMPQMKPPTDAMPCAGCGAKLGHDVLSRALARLETVARPDVLVGLDAPDDAAVVELPHGMLAVHTIDVMPALVADPFIAGKIAAHHCLSDIYAMRAAPHTALATVTLPEGHPGVQEDTLTDLIAGALSVLMNEHTALVGGHTLQGDRLEFGLSVNGVINRDRLLHARAPQPGDRLILTKPIGIGAIFAADMRGLARSSWVAEALRHMLQSNRDAARILFEHVATACTDVTGFGLAGHVIQLLERHTARAQVQFDRIPLLKGAIAATRQGVRSTLFPSNVRTERGIHPGAAARVDTYPLLFDPQTAGGLLACIPPSHAQACIEALHTADYIDAADIGEIVTYENGDARRLSLR